MPVVGAAGSLGVRTHTAGLGDLWTKPCRCFSFQVAVRDARGNRVRGLQVRVSSVPTGLVVDKWSSSRITTVPGTAGFRLATTARLRSRHAKFLTLRIDLSEPSGRTRTHTSVRISLPAGDQA